MQVYTGRRLSQYLIALAAIVMGLASGCSTRMQVKPPLHPQASYEEMTPPQGSSHYTLKPGNTAVRPVLDRQVLPGYPIALARRGSAPITVVVQLAMSEDGRVQSVHPVSNTAAEPVAGLFEAAVEQAVMQWTFTPMFVQHPRGDGTYSVTQKPFSLWYVFRFKMVDGKPVVESARR